MAYTANQHEPPPASDSLDPCRAALLVVIAAIAAVLGYQSLRVLASTAASPPIGGATLASAERPRLTPVGVSAARHGVAGIRPSRSSR